MVNLNYYLNNFSRNLEVITALLKNNSGDEISWKPLPDKWSLLEIICHLRDEEKEDFRARIESVLNDPAKPWPAIDPQGWVTQRNYAVQNFNLVLNEFEAERSRSIMWLGSLAAASWNSTYQHPKLGAMSASQLLANWLAHDHIHIRQITKLKYDYLKHISAEDLSYAGDW